MSEMITFETGKKPTLYVKIGKKRYRVDRQIEVSRSYATLLDQEGAEHVSWDQCHYLEARGAVSLIERCSTEHGYFYDRWHLDRDKINECIAELEQMASKVPQTTVYEEVV